MYNVNTFESTNVRCRTYSKNDDFDGDDNDENFDNKHVIVLFYDYIFHLKNNKMPELSWIQEFELSGPLNNGFFQYAFVRIRMGKYEITQVIFLGRN